MSCLLYRAMGTKKEKSDSRLRPPRARYLLQFAEVKEGEEETLVKYVVKQLEAQGLSCEVVENKEKYLVVSATVDVLAKQVLEFFELATDFTD